MIPTPAPTIASVATLPHQIAQYFSSIVELTHKQATAVCGHPRRRRRRRSPTGAKTGSAILLGYAALCHIAERFLKA